MFIVSKPHSFTTAFVIGLIVGFFLGTHAVKAEPPFPPIPNPQIWLPAPGPVPSGGEDSASFSYADNIVTLTGPIEADTPYMLDYKIKANGWQVAGLGLQSGGGSLQAARQLVAMVERHHWRTIAGHCSSSCVLVWAAGSRELLPQHFIGVHNAYDKFQFSHPIAKKDSRKMAAFLKSRGAPSSVIKGLLETPPNKMYQIFDAELGAWK